jgi:hypothetical protein
MCFFDNSIAINNHQLRFLTSKCKSSINGLLQSMGYGTVPSGSDPARALAEFLPPVRGNFAELRKWTVRQKASLTAAPGDVAVGEPAPPLEFVTPPPDLDRPDNWFGTEIGTEGPKEPTTFAEPSPLEMAKLGEQADGPFGWDDLCFFP